MEKEEEGFIDVQEMERIIKKILFHREDLSPQSYQTIKDLLDSIEIPFMFRGLALGKQLFRCRIHKEGETFFNKIDDITYRKDSHNIHDFGRANEPYQSMFYCSDMSQTAFFETSKVIRDDISYDKEIVTIGKWEVCQDLNLVNFIISEYKNKAHERNPLIQFFLKEFKEAMVEMDFKEDWIKFMTFFSEEFIDEELETKQYKTTAAFANYIYNFIGEDYHTNEIRKPHGIIYPSARYSSQGLNIVIKPELIDQGALKLIDVKRFTFTKVNEKDYEETECIDSKSINLQTGKIDWNI